MNNFINLNAIPILPMLVQWGKIGFIQSHVIQYDPDDWLAIFLWASLMNLVKDSIN